MHDNLSSNDESISIRKNLDQLDDAAREISDKRVPLLRQLNALQSKTRVLPLETLSLIFQHACVPRKIPRIMSGLPVGKHRRENLPFFPVFLGSISHTWRQVAWSTPQLWTELSVVIPSNKTEIFASLLDLYLTNTRGIPITLHITFKYQRLPNLENDPPVQIFSREDPSAQVFFREENLRKLGNIKLTYPPTTWLSSFDGPFSQLVEIHLTGGSMSLENTTFLSNAPMLRNISLTRARVPLQATGPLLTNLKLEEVPTAVALRCLLASPNLIELHYTFPTPDPRFPDDENEEEEEESLEVPNDLTLCHLQNLQWPFKLDSASNTFLHQIRLPALRSLTWDQRGKSLTDGFSEGIWTFFQNLSNSPVTTLYLRNFVEMRPAFMKHIYHQNSRIESLFLELCDEETLYVALASLVPGWNGEEPADARRYLTRLKTLVVRHCAAEDNSYHVAPILWEYFGDIVADLLIGRISADVSSDLCINLVFDKRTKIMWAEETKERLQEFSQGGTTVHLLEDGERMSWL